MAFYLDEEEVWKCSKHRSKRRRIGVCPVCLRERLASLCPNCARRRPCTCSEIESEIEISTTTTFFPRFSLSGGEFRDSRIGSIGRLSNLIENEPDFRRSRSVTAPFLRSNLNRENRETGCDDSGSVTHRAKTMSFWSIFKSRRKSTVSENGEDRVEMSKIEEERRKRMMRKSRSVAVVMSDSGDGELRSLPVPKAKSWYFPSPMKAFRQSRASKVSLQEHSPLYRG